MNKEYNGSNKYYKKNRENISKNNKLKKLTEEEIEKKREYQKNYWKNIRKKKLQEEFKLTGTDHMREYSRNRYKKLYKIPDKPKLERKLEKNIIDFI
jgi:hypothetical protein